jgi:membrane dipeptidase
MGKRRDKGIFKMKVSAYLIIIVSLVTLILQPAVAGDDAADLAHAHIILEGAPLFDGHNDLPWVIREELGGDVEGFDISVRAKFVTDIPRLREGGVGTQFWAVYVPSSVSPVEAMTQQLEQIDVARRMISLYPDEFALAMSVADIAAAREQGRIASLLGIEGGHAIVNSLGALRAYFDLGVRYMTLTHFNGIDWADSATDKSRHEGLTTFGEEVVREMNRMGMILDLSHVSVATMNDALDVTSAPVMFSHSSARALTGHSRNIPDTVLKRVADNGGVVMVTFVPQFVNELRREWDNDWFAIRTALSTSAETEEARRLYVEANGSPPLATLSDVADHIDHVARVAGHDHVGIGGDFVAGLGISPTVGLEDVSKYPYLIAELISRGWSDEDLAKLSRDNMIRVFSEVEDVSAELKKSRQPSLKTIEELDRG